MIWFLLFLALLVIHLAGLVVLPVWVILLPLLPLVLIWSFVVLMFILVGLGAWLESK